MGGMERSARYIPLLVLSFTLSYSPRGVKVTRACPSWNVRVALYLFRESLVVFLESSKVAPISG